MKLGWICVVVAFVITAIMAMAACLPGDVPGAYEPRTPVAVPQVYAALMLDEGFTLRERNLIVQGIEQWVMASNGRIIYEIIDHTESAAEHMMGARVPWSSRCVDVIEINNAFSTDGLIESHDEYKTTTRTIGLAHRQACEISSVWLVSDRLETDRSWVWVSAHEFGHAIGLGHVENRRATMYRTLTGISADCITKWDIEELCDEIVCELRDTRYCIP